MNRKKGGDSAWLCTGYTQLAIPLLGWFVVQACQTLLQLRNRYHDSTHGERSGWALRSYRIHTYLAGVASWTGMRGVCLM